MLRNTFEVALHHEQRSHLLRLSNLGARFGWHPLSLSLPKLYKITITSFLFLHYS